MQSRLSGGSEKVSRQNYKHFYILEWFFFLRGGEEERERERENVGLVGLSVNHFIFLMFNYKRINQEQCSRFLQPSKAICGTQLVLVWSLLCTDYCRMGDRFVLGFARRQWPSFPAVKVKCRPTKILRMRLYTRPWKYTHAKRSHTHDEDSVVHVRVRLILVS